MTTGLGFVGAIAVARFVDAPEVYGSFFILLAVAEALMKPVGGWVAGCRKRITERDNAEERFFGAAWVVVAGSFGILTPVLWGLNDVLARYVIIDSPWLPLWILFVSNGVFTYSLNILNVRGNFGVGPWIDGIQGLLKYGFQIALVLAGFGVWGMAIGFATAALLVTPVIWWSIGIRPALPDLEVMRSTWDFARLAIPGTLLGTLLGRVDTLMLGFFTSSAVVGNYQVTNQITMVMPMIVGVASGGLLGRISDLHSVGKRIDTVTEDVLNISVVIALPVLVGGLIIGPQIIWIPFGTKYEMAFVFFLWVAIYRTISAYNSPMASVVNGMDRPDYALRARVVKFTSNIVGGIIGFYVFGPIGIVVASVLSQLLTTVLYARFVQKHTAVNLFPWTIRLQALASLVMGIVVYGLKTQIGVAKWYHLVSLVGAGGIVYGAVLLFDEWHRETFVGTVREFI
ncbi:lipopolysaccharide biosynthesis protein [Halorientalis persicus]|uniref:lipopolysaccharide biosynthesis protein n=1 Tax=Halorientalis persicus TaxID=1367881 RepID=UPI00147B9DA2|nr:oligosaccharide flippase family protein [Halorientalis persicus]